MTQKILDDNGGDLEAAAQEFAAFPTSLTFYMRFRRLPGARDRATRRGT